MPGLKWRRAKHERGCLHVIVESESPPHAKHERGHLRVIVTSGIPGVTERFPRGCPRRIGAFLSVFPQGDRAIPRGCPRRIAPSLDFCPWGDRTIPQGSVAFFSRMCRRPDLSSNCYSLGSLELAHLNYPLKGGYSYVP